MRGIVLMVLVVGVAALAAKADSTNDRINEIDNKKPIRIDPYLRKALLKALTDLEQNSSEPSEYDQSSETSSPEESEVLRSGDDIDISVHSDKREQANFHSFVVDGRNAFKNTSTIVPGEIKQTPLNQPLQKNDDQDIIIKFTTLDPLNEVFETRETSNLQQTRSITNKINEAEADKSKVNKKPVYQKPSTTTSTTTTTTTTTPKPTHNEDGENIEEVDNHDVQVFQAPLVAAFTVHQDETGLPRKVVPIYKQTTRVPITPLIQTHETLFKQQLSIQQQLEQKQRELERQIQILQQQQKQQEEYLKRQQLIQQQQTLIKNNQERQRQQQLLLEQQQRLRQQNYLDQQKKFQQENLFRISQYQQDQQRQALRQQNLVSSNAAPFAPIQPISNPSVDQQLPNREAVDFLIHLRNQKVDLPLQEGTHVPPLPLFDQQPPFENSLRGNFQNNFNNQNNFNHLNNFNNQNSFNNQQFQTDQLRQVQGNRVFRHESGTGNFGFNNGFNSNFQIIPSIQSQFPPSPIGNPSSIRQHRESYNPNNDLQFLLRESGISNGGRSQEDLNIVSKILSLNHGINTHNFLHQDRNFLFGESRISERKVKAPKV